MINLKKEKIIWSSLFISSIFLYVLTDIPNMFFMIIILLIYGGMALGLTKLTGRNLTVQFMGVLQGQKKEVLKVEVSVKNEDKLPVCCGALIFKVKKFLYLFTYFTLLGLSCHTQDLSLQCAGFSSCPVARGILVS